jgi:hypothetical protein
MLILVITGVFIAGLTAGGLLFTFESKQSTPPAFDGGWTGVLIKTALQTPHGRSISGAHN